MEPETYGPHIADKISEAEAAAETTAVEPEAPVAEAASAPEEAAPEAKRRLTPFWIVTLLATIGVIGLSLFVILSTLFPSLTEAKPGTGAYALKINDTEYSAAEVNYEYMAIFQQYSQYAAYFGSVLPDDPFTMSEEADYETWGDFYMAQTEEKLKQLTSLCDLAERDGVTLDDEDTAEIDTWIEQLKTSAAAMGKDDFDAFISENFGEGVNEQVLRDMATRETLAMKYVEYYQENYSVSDEEIEAAYQADKDTYDTYRFHYYLAEAEIDEETGLASDEALAAAQEKAETILAEAGQGDGEALDRMKAAVGEDDAVQAAAMDGDTLTQYQVPFESWLKDADRAAGDMTVAEQSGYGYFVILFESRERSDDPTVSVRHILIQAEDADADGEISEDELAAAKAEIEQINAEWEAGEQTEEAFAALANQYSTDPGSNTNGGLYENVYEGQMVPEFNDFCFDASRKAGDVAIVPDETYNGYHLMYFVGRGESYTNQVIRDKLLSDGMEEFANSLTENVTVIEGKDMEKVGLTESFLAALQGTEATTTTP